VPSVGEEIPPLLEISSLLQTMHSIGNDRAEQEGIKTERFLRKRGLKKMKKNLKKGKIKLKLSRFVSILYNRDRVEHKE
jgi:hypothetical protein